MSKEELEEMIDKLRGDTPTDKLKAEVDSIIKSDNERAKVKAKEIIEDEKKFKIEVDKFKAEIKAKVKKPQIKTDPKDLETWV